MKKYLSFLIAMTMVIAMFAGCGAPPAPAAPAAPATPAAPADPAAPAAPTTEKLKVANIVNGNLGDKSFFDSCEAGLKQLATDGVIEYKTFELGATDADKPKWKSALDELAMGGEYDLIICGTYQMPEYLSETAKNNPDQKFLFYDGECAEPNVASVTYKQNDLGYLVGTAAALITTSGMDSTNPDKLIGFVGGEDGPVINDFLVGYIQGAQAVDKDMKVDTQYVGNFFDTGKGKELANVMYKNKADIVWGVAGGAGNGVAESANENKGLFIGVDSDQEATFSVSQPELAAVTMFSGLKNIGDSMVLSITQMKEGKLEFGKTALLGLGDGGVGITTGGNYAKLSPEIKSTLDGLTAKVASGEVKVDSAFDSTFDVKALRDSARP